MNYGPAGRVQSDNATGRRPSSGLATEGTRRTRRLATRVLWGTTQQRGVRPEKEEEEHSILNTRVALHIDMQDGEQHHTARRRKYNNEDMRCQGKQQQQRYRHMSMNLTTLRHHDGGRSWRRHKASLTGHILS